MRGLYKQVELVNKGFNKWVREEPGKSHFVPKVSREGAYLDMHKRWCFTPGLRVANSFNPGHYSSSNFKYSGDFSVFPLQGNYHIDHINLCLR